MNTCEGQRRRAVTHFVLLPIDSSSPDFQNLLLNAGRIYWLVPLSLISSCLVIKNTSVIFLRFFLNFYILGILRSQIGFFFLVSGAWNEPESRADMTSDLSLFYLLLYSLVQWILIFSLWIWSTWVEIYISNHLLHKV